MKEYIEFLKDKMAISHQTGFEVNQDDLTPSLYPHVKDTVRWAVSGGCRAIFSSFGMQKTVTQLEILRVVLKHKGGKGLIVCPKRVVVEFLTQAEQHLHMKVTYVRTMADVMICQTDIMVTNYERGHVYDYEEHVSFAEELEAYGKLPKTFMAVDPVSKKPWIWDDVTRMRTLNTKQSQKKRQNHICPLQLDIVERLIERYSNRGELVFDPFGGIGTVPYCAINLGRKGLSTELNYDYWKDSLSYLYEAEMEVSAPTLFDLMNDAV